MSARPDVAALIVAGGSGLRFGGKIRKQYVQLNGWPLLRWSLHAFDSSPSIESLMVVAPASDIRSLEQQLAGWRMKKPVRVTAGGVTRADSVRHGLSALLSPARWVAVHDAVRPLITVEVIEKIIAETRRHRAAIAAIPAKDTVKLADAEGRITSTPERSTVWLAQTPQIFERRLLERAHADGRDRIVTDDAQLVEHLGVRVKLVEASPDNIKVTLPLDLLLAQALVGKRSKSLRSR